jgi:hypothetical protein
MIDLDPKNNAISDHFDEVEKEVAQLIQGDIERMVNSRLGGLSAEAVNIDGDILKGMHISAVAGPAVDLEDVVGEAKIEEAVMDALDYNYTNALDRASQIVAARHPEDEL